MKNIHQKGFFKTLEDNFAAAAMTEASLDSAREFLKQREAMKMEPVASVFGLRVKAFIKYIETWFAAAGLAEGDAEVARTYLKDQNIRLESPRYELLTVKIKSFIRAFEEAFAAAAMAEGSPEMAREYLKYKVPARQKPSLNEFLQTVGLKGVPVQFRVAMV